MEILGSHNSWSYLPVRKWWMKPIRFMARCQRVDIRRQYELGVRCFDLRVRFKNGLLTFAHGIVEYNHQRRDWMTDMEWLNQQGDVYVRVIHEVRNRKQSEESLKSVFRLFCDFTSWSYPNIRFWCGRNLYTWEKDFDFGDDPECEERYASVTPPKLLAWWPWLYARIKNKDILKDGTKKEILLIDFVDLGME